ncbi:MAG: nitroreductase family protein [Bacteroidales bacterium]|nr:nitroreductase family protein [Bacteroidales bacterium]
MEDFDFIGLCERRYSCRNYSDLKIEKETLDTILRAAQLAPSACNRQPWRFYIVEDADKRAELLAKSKPAFLAAPVVIAAVGLHDVAWHRPSDGKDHTDIDVAIAVEHICLAAADQGVGSCWVCSFDVEAARRVLKLTEGEEPIALIPLGYPSDAAIPNKDRKPLHEIIRHA